MRKGKYMTQEEMAAMIQNGASEYIVPLWEAVEKLVYMIARKYYYGHQEICAKAGVEEQDLLQESFFGFLLAVQYFKPDSGCKFTSFLDLPLKNCFNDMCGMRTQRDRKDPVNSAVNIEKPIGEEDITLLDMLEDPAAAQEFSSLEAGMDNKMLHDVLEKCLDTLKPVEANTVRMRFYEGLTLEEVGKRLGVSRNMARSREADGLRNLRRGESGKMLKPWRADIISTSYHLGGLGKWKNTHTSSTEWAVLQMDEREKDLYRKYGYL